MTGMDGAHTLQIAGRCLGYQHSPLIIAEVAQAHDGSLGQAHAFVDAVAETGADAIKFQTHIAEAESSYDEPYRVKFSWQDATRYAYWQRMEFTEAQWVELARHATERGLIFLSSPFSVEAVDLLERIGVPAWKVGSGEIQSGRLLSELARTGQPILCSTGIATWGEINDVVRRFRECDVPFVLLQCTTQYPTPLADIGLNVVEGLRQAYGCPAGLSDHSGSVFPGMAALARGADVLECHVTFDRRMFGPDTVASVTIDELAQLCRFRDALVTMDNNPVNKDEQAEQLSHLRETFGKSLALSEALPAGTVLAAEHLTEKKPGSGISPVQIDQVIGKQLARRVPSTRLLQWKDLTEYA